VTSQVDAIADATPAMGKLGFDRLVFFSDAVFAIAMTLLVVDLRLPELLSDEDQVVADALLEAQWDIFAYVLSVLVIGSFWLAHWRRYHHIARVDGRHAFLNLLFLGAVAFIPFPTSVLGTAGDPPPAVVFYAVSVSIAALLGVLAVIDAWRRGLFVAGVQRSDARTWVISGLVVPVVMMGSLVVILPFLGSGWTEATWVAAAVLGGVWPRRRA
jgi:uncharacterized membrane protein